MSNYVGIKLNAGINVLTINDDYKLSGGFNNDSSGKLNKGLLIGDYKIVKTEENQPMKRDSFIKVAKKSSSPQPVSP